MTPSQQSAVRRSEPIRIDSGAAETLRYIRSTIDTAQRFTTVPGKGYRFVPTFSNLGWGAEAGDEPREPARAS